MTPVDDLVAWLTRVWGDRWSRDQLHGLCWLSGRTMPHAAPARPAVRRSSWLQAGVEAMTWKPDDGTLSYAYIRELEQELFGEWFTVDGLPSKADEERLRPIKLARAFEVAEENAAVFAFRREIEGWQP